MDVTVSAPMLLVITVRVALPGNVMVRLASPMAGTPPADQLPAVLQLPFTAPLQVCEPA